jgi:HlyD family secretion protein
MNAPAHRTHGSAISPFRVVVVVVLVAAGLVAWQLTRPSGPAYRIATVSTGTAVASLSSVGTVTPVNQANLSFEVAGTVGAVDVTVGQQVTAGETLASLDSTPLKNTVIADQASLASAQATLASDEASQTASTTTTTSATLTDVVTLDSTGSPPTSGGGTPGGGTSGGSESVAQLQAKLVADQKQEDADSAAASAALATATTVCTAPSTPADNSAPAPTSSTTPTTTPPTTPTCAEALSAASAAQTTLAGDIKTVTADEAALTAALEAAASSSSGSGSSGGSPTGSSDGSTGSASGGKTSGGNSSTGSAGSGSGSAGSGATKAKVVTAQKLALDQADIDVAQANLDSAQQALASANLVSTVSGTVGSVTLSAGSSSTGGQVVVLGSGDSYQVVATVPVTSIGKVAIGQQALVTPDSSGTAVPGTVTGIGVLATAGSTSTTYPVTVTIQSSSLGLFSGGEAGVSIVTGRAVGVTTVPTSAVRTVGTIHLVTEVNGTTTKQVKVTTGIVGPVLTQITSGITPGHQVSIATMDLPVPSSSTTSTRFAGLGGAAGFSVGAGGFGGGPRAVIAGG